MDGAASRATVTLGENNSHSLAWSLIGMRAGIGFRHWNRVDGSKCAHCLQQCSAEAHLGQLPFQSRSEGSVVEQLKHRAATTFCKSLGRRGPVTSIGGRGPEGFGRSAGRRSPDPLLESIYPRCLYLRSSSMCLNRLLEFVPSHYHHLERWPLHVRAQAICRINSEGFCGNRQGNLETNPARA